MKLDPQTVDIWFIKVTDRQANRARLRELVSRYTGIPSEKIEFSFGPLGKPALKNSNSDLRFNLSHSGDRAIFAFSYGFDIGVDIEGHRENVNETQIAERLFSYANRKLMVAAKEARTEFFFRLWTFHEAYLKALGQSVFSAPTIAEKLSLHDLNADRVSGPDFCVRKLDTPMGFYAAVAGLVDHFEIRVCESN